MQEIQGKKNRCSIKLQITFNFSICEATGRFCIPWSTWSLLELSSTSISGNSFDDNITGKTASTNVQI